VLFRDSDTYLDGESLAVGASRRHLCKSPGLAHPLGGFGVLRGSPPLFMTGLLPSVMMPYAPLMTSVYALVHTSAYTNWPTFLAASTVNRNTSKHGIVD
jgi:hypothetical protein